MDETSASLKKALRARWVIWGVMAAAFMVVFFHRLAAGVVRADLVRDFGLSATSFGSLAALYFYAYMAMQVPVGMLTDTLGARATVTAGMLIAGAGSALFGLAPTPGLLFLGRFLVGIGVSTVFVSILKIQSQWFREREFATMSGITSLVGNLGGVLAQAPLALAVAAFSWRITFVGIGIFSILLALLCWIFIRNRPQDRGWPALNEAQAGITPPKPRELLSGLSGVVRQWRVWPNFVLSGCSSGLYLAFSGAWGTSFLKDVYGMERMAASGIVAYSVYGGMTGGLMAGVDLGQDRPPAPTPPSPVYGLLRLLGGPGLLGRREAARSDPPSSLLPAGHDGPVLLPGLVHRQGNQPSTLHRAGHLGGQHGGIPGNGPDHDGHGSDPGPHGGTGGSRPVPERIHLLPGLLHTEPRLRHPPAGRPAAGTSRYPERRNRKNKGAPGFAGSPFALLIVRRIRRPTARKG